MRRHVNECKLFSIPTFNDERGMLSVLEGEGFVPFVIRRVFYVYGLKGKLERGDHAHRNTEEFIVCLNGSLSVYLNDGKNASEFILDNPSMGLYIPPLIWSRQKASSPESIYVVLASSHHDKTEAIYDRNEFEVITNG